MVGAQVCFMHYMGASPKNYCVPVGSILSGLSKHMSRQKNLTKETAASEDFIYAGALDMARRYEGDDGNWSKREMHNGLDTEYLIIDHNSGRSYVISANYSKAWDYEMHNKRYLDENSDQTFERVTSERYQHDVDEWDYEDTHTDEEKRRDEIEKMDKEREEQRRQMTPAELARAEQEEDLAMLALANAGSGMAAMAIGEDFARGTNETGTLKICACGDYSSQWHLCPFVVYEAHAKCNKKFWKGFPGESSIAQRLWEKCMAYVKFPKGQIQLTKSANPAVISQVFESPLEKVPVTLSVQSKGVEVARVPAGHIFVAGPIDSSMADNADPTSGASELDQPIPPVAVQPQAPTDLQVLIAQVADLKAELKKDFRVAPDKAPVVAKMVVPQE